MRHFVHYPNGGPHPGTCALCGSTKDFFDTGAQHFSGGNVMLCRSCIADLAENIGFTLAAPMLEKCSNLEMQNAKLLAELDAIPNQIEGLIDGIRSNLADFVLAISSSGDSGIDLSVQTDNGLVKGDREGVKGSEQHPEARLEPSLDKGSTGVSAGSVNNRRVSRK